MPEEYDGDQYEDLERPPSFFPYNGDELDRELVASADLVETRVEGVFAAENNGSISRFVLLSDGVRKLPILIGPFEAQAIQLVVESTRPDRPLTHDLIKTIIERLDGDVDRVVIDDFWNQVFYAKIFVTRGEDEIEIDSRPSDAVAIAMRFEAPIYVSEALLDQGIDF